MSLSLLQLRSLVSDFIENPSLTDIESLKNITTPNVSIQNILTGLQKLTNIDDYIGSLTNLINSINNVISPVHAPVSLQDVVSELTRISEVVDARDQQILIGDYIPYISRYIDTSVLKSSLGTNNQKTTISNFVQNFISQVKNVSSLSLLQLRNLATNILENPPENQGLSEQQYIDSLKNAILRITVPNVSIQSIVNTFQQPASISELNIALRSLVSAIDVIVPPVHTPISLQDISSELGRINQITDLQDQQILVINYIPYLSQYISTSDLRASLGTSNQKTFVNSFVQDFNRRVYDFSDVPQFQFIVPSYNNYVKSLQLARSKQEADAVVAAYTNLIYSLVHTSLVIPPWTFPTEVSISGFYTQTKSSNTAFMVYLTEQTPGLNISNGWVVTGLSGVYGNVRVVEYTANVYGDVVISVGPPAVSFPFVSNALVVSDQPNLDMKPSSIMRLTFTPPIAAPAIASNVVAAPSFGYYDPRYFDATNIIGTPGELRDLNSNVMTSEGREVYTTVVDRGAGTGALTALAAVGSQDNYMYGGESKWTPQIRQHTPFVISQRLTIPLRDVGGYLGNTVQINLFPKERGDLISNMYLKCSLPALPVGYYYTELTGRAIIQKAEFLVDGEVYESITDDWYVINDQLTLDADEKLGMYQLISNGTPENTNVTATSQLSLIVPLEFFFCRRYTHMRENKKPYFPMCALTNSTISVRFTFNKASWITNAPISVDLIKPQLLLEEITLSPEERLFYRSQPIKLRVPRVWQEAVQPFSNGIARLNLTANFNVSMMVWFIRNKAYENENSSYYASRYSYGYTTNYIVAATPVTFFNGVQLRYIDTIDYATLYLNNNNVLSNFPGGLYYTFKQAIDHKLSVPTKSLYMYSFSERPLQYNHDGGSINFSKLNSQTTHLDIKFLEQYAPQIQSEYSLNLYYYGYVNIEISNGRINRI